LGLSAPTETLKRSCQVEPAERALINPYFTLFCEPDGFNNGTVLYGASAGERVEPEFFLEFCPIAQEPAVKRPRVLNGRFNPVLAHDYHPGEAYLR